MRIVRALAGYAEVPLNFPILVSANIVINEPAFAWLLELATIPGRSHAVETIRTYSEHLREWFDALEQSGMDWRTVSEIEIAYWRNRMLMQVSPHTKRPYARSTINERVRTVCRFYFWAHQHGWIDLLPFHFVDVRVRRHRGIEGWWTTDAAKVFRGTSWSSPEYRDDWKVAYSPRVTSIHGLPNETDDECCAGYDEWYVFEQPVLPGEIEVFVNWLGFRLYDPDFKWCADRLWEQMTRLAPESYVGDGSVFTFATRNGALFTRVLSAFSASAE